jgi:hypothetical protein
MDTSIAKPDPAQLSVWTPTFVSSPNEMKARVQAKRAFYKDVMTVEQHYGKIPGSEKDVLFKPGAELLLSSMGLFADLVDAQVIQDYDGSAHGGEPLIAYRRACLIYRQTGPTENERVRIARAEGFCSSREKKYRYRDSKPECPLCGKQAIFISKKDDGAFFCWKKEGGCGVNFNANDERITKQPQGKVWNPEIYDLENTILKMADKRAYVAATLLATGCSDIFTQDLEDDHHEPRNVTPKDAPRNGNGSGESDDKKLHDARAATKALIAEKKIPAKDVAVLWADLIGDFLMDYPIWESGDISMIRGMYKAIKSWEAPKETPPEPTRADALLAKMQGVIPAEDHPGDHFGSPTLPQETEPVNNAEITLDMVTHQAKRKGLDKDDFKVLVAKATGSPKLTAENIPKVYDALTAYPLPMISDDDLEKIAGNVPPPDMRALAVQANKCGMDMRDVSALIGELALSTPLTADSYKQLLGEIDARVAAAV